MLTYNASSRTCTIVISLQVLSRSYLQKICDKRRRCARGLYSIRVKKNKGALEGKGQRMRGKKQTSGTGAWTPNKNTWTRLKSLYSNLGSLQNNKTRSSFNLEGFYRGTKPSKHERLKFAFSSFVLRRKFMDQNSSERAKMLTHFQVFGLIPAAAFDLSVVGSINTFVFLWKERRV